MKYSELHKLIVQAGWTPVPKRGKGGHIMYAKNGVMYPVPYHGAAEIQNYFAKKILKDLGINDNSI